MKCQCEPFYEVPQFCTHCGWNVWCQCGYAEADNVEYEYDDNWWEGYE